MKHQITLQAAIEMTAAFQQSRPPGMAYSESFEREAIERLLQTPGCSKIRIYYGRKNEEIHAILVAVNSDGDDLLPAAEDSKTISAEEEPVIIEDSYRCPPHCPPDSPLNP